MSWTFCIQAFSFMAFRLELWRSTSVLDPRTTCFSRSLVYAATHWLLAADFWRAAMPAGAIHPGVFPGWVRMLRRIELEPSVPDGETWIPIYGAALVAEMIVRRMHGDPAR